MEDREQRNLIGSDKVEGTAVYGANNEKIGSIECVKEANYGLGALFSHRCITLLLSKLLLKKFVSD